jgi:hypothetical protein
MSDWLLNGVADGFNIMPLLLPSGLTEFVDRVVPELQSRGLFYYCHPKTTGFVGSASGPWARSIKLRAGIEGH